MTKQNHLFRQKLVGVINSISAMNNCRPQYVTTNCLKTDSSQCQRFCTVYTIQNTKL